MVYLWKMEEDGKRLNGGWQVEGIYERLLHERSHSGCDEHVAVMSNGYGISNLYASIIIVYCVLPSPPKSKVKTWKKKYLHLGGKLFAIDPAQIAVPANGNDIGEEHAVLEREKGKVNGLDKGPDHPVGAEGGPPGLLEALLGRITLHGGHAAEEDGNHGGRKDGLIDKDAGEGLDALVGRGDAAGEKVEPGGSGRTKYNLGVMLLAFIPFFFVVSFSCFMILALPFPSGL